MTDVPWTIDPAQHPESGERVWCVKDASSGTVWAVFYDHVAASACISGWKAIGFVPDRPTVELNVAHLAALDPERTKGG